MPSPVEEALERLGPPEEIFKRHGGTVRRGKARCLFHDHDDRSPSVSFFEDYNGKPRWKCHGCLRGGDAIDLARALGERVELHRERSTEPKPQPKPRPLTAAERKLARKLAASETFSFDFVAAKVLARLHWHAAEVEVLRNFDYLAANGNVDFILRLSDVLRALLPERYGLPRDFCYSREHVEGLCAELSR